MVSPLLFPGFCALAGERDEEDSSFLNLFHLVNAQADFHKEILYLAMGSNSSSTT